MASYGCCPVQWASLRNARLYCGDGRANVLQQEAADFASSKDCRLLLLNLMLPSKTRDVRCAPAYDSIRARLPAASAEKGLASTLGSIHMGKGSTSWLDLHQHCRRAPSETGRRAGTKSRCASFA